MPPNTSKYTGAAAFIDPHYILIEPTEIHHNRPSKTPIFLSRFHKKVNGTGACHINGRNYHLPEQTRSRELVQGPHTLVMDLVLAFMEMNILVRNLDLDFMEMNILVRNFDLNFMEMNILLNRYSANKKTYISDLRQL